MDQNELFGMTLEEANDALKHHGIRGQKWGIRRSPEQLGHRAAKKQAKKEAKEAAKARKAEIKKSRSHTSASKLTDAELQQRIKRLRDEETYNNLKNNTSIISAGKKMVGDIAMNTVKDVGGQTAKYYGAKLMNAVITNKIDPSLEKILKDAGFDDISNSGPIKPNAGKNSKEEELKKKLKELEEALDHSDSDEDTLEHKNGFKYISRKRVNGRWVYEYASDSMTNTPTNGDPRLEKSQSGVITLQKYKTASSTNDKRLQRSQTGDIHVTETGKKIGAAVEKVGDAAVGAVKKHLETKKALDELGITKQEYKEYQKKKAEEAAEKKRVKKYVKTLNMTPEEYYKYFKHSDDELAHHGVLGQKWGVRRAKSLTNKNNKIIEKHNKQAIKANTNYEKAIKYGNKEANNAYKHFERKSDKINKKLWNTTDENKRQKLIEKSNAATAAAIFYKTVSPEYIARMYGDKHIQQVDNFNKLEKKQKEQIRKNLEKLELLDKKLSEQGVNISYGKENYKKIIGK